MIKMTAIEQITAVRVQGPMARLLSSILGRILKRKLPEQTMLTVRADDAFALSHPERLRASLARQFGVTNDAVQITALDYISNLARVTINLNRA